VQQVTVLSVWWNREEVVQCSLTSLFQQADINARYLIVDDGSTDKTLSGIRALRSDFSELDIQVISQPNQGLAHTLQHWSSSIETPYIAIHGAGDISAPRRLRVQVDHAQATGAVVVGCLVGVHDGSGALSNVRDRPRNCAKGEALPDSVPYPGTHGAAVIETAAFQKVGGYRSEFRYAQDTDLWLRISRLGAFSAVESLLYWQYRREEKVVSRTVHRRFAQIQFGELARQCEEDRQSGRPDLVDRFGADAVHLLRDSARLRARLTRRDWDGAELGGVAAMRGLRGQTALFRAARRVKRRLQRSAVEPSP
jgi:glycosyltransferase involved in cell wall biosynthesis